MSIAPYLKIIGRGKEGARALGVDDARDLFEQVLDGRASDLEVGAFCLAMRIKGETVEELDGFLQATHARCLPLPESAQASARGIVVLPSYNGSRKLPNLTPLLAAELARQGVGVLVHGAAEDPTRITSAQIFAALHWPIVKHDDALRQAWQQGRPAFMELDDLCAPLARLLPVRWTIGLRNPGHTVAKLIDPFSVQPQAGTRSIRVINYTHPEYAQSLRAFATHIRANAMLMRGTEGEPVADARRQPRCDVYLHGEQALDLSLAPEEGVLTELPALPETGTASETAGYIDAVLAGRTAMPVAIQAQADALVHALKRVGPAAEATA